MCVYECLSACMCIWVCFNSHVCICLYIYLNLAIDICTSTHKCPYTCTHLCTHPFIHTGRHTHAILRAYIFLQTHIIINANISHITPHVKLEAYRCTHVYDILYSDILYNCLMILLMYLRQRRLAIVLKCPQYNEFLCIVFFCYYIISNNHFKAYQLTTVAQTVDWESKQLSQSLSVPIFTPSFLFLSLIFLSYLSCSTDSVILSSFFSSS